MQIREATENDIPDILEVLRASLGEVSSKKTENVWRFKHISNPFGKSLILVAEEGNDIIGVRAFMRWQWEDEEKVYSCFRAVDTATHPKHQGKGIFKKLTLKAIDLAKEEGGHFIFNTPNDQSLPGYLKMGWEKVNQLKVQLYPTSPFYWSFTKNDNYLIDIKVGRADLKTICMQRNIRNKRKKKYFTPKTPEFLEWRYEKNPLQDYEVFADKELYIAGYIKKHKYLKELRIVEILLREEVNHDRVASITQDWVKKFGANFISFSEGYNLSKMKIKGNYGPVLTVRNLNLDGEAYNKLLNLNNFSYSLGDLELF